MHKYIKKNMSDHLSLHISLFLFLPRPLISPHLVFFSFCQSAFLFIFISVFFPIPRVYLYFIVLSIDFVVPSPILLLDPLYDMNTRQPKIVVPVSSSVKLCLGLPTPFVFRKPNSSFIRERRG